MDNTSRPNGFQRRLKAAIIWGLLVNVAFYVCVFKGFAFEWWLEYVKWHTYALGFLVSGLTITDAVLHNRKK